MARQILKTPSAGPGPIPNHTQHDPYSYLPHDHQVEQPYFLDITIPEPEPAATATVEQPTCLEMPVASTSAETLDSVHAVSNGDENETEISMPKTKFHMPKVMRMMLQEYYTTETHYPSQAQRQMLLMKLRTLPGCENYGAEQLRRYFENRRTKKQEYKDAMRNNGTTHADTEKARRKASNNQRRVPVRPKNIFMVPKGAREILSEFFENSSAFPTHEDETNLLMSIRIVDGCEDYDVKRLRRWFENRRHKQRAEAFKQGITPDFDINPIHNTGYDPLNPIPHPGDMAPNGSDLHSYSQHDSLDLQ